MVIFSTVAQPPLQPPLDSPQSPLDKPQPVVIPSPALRGPEFGKISIEVVSCVNWIQLSSWVLPGAYEGIQASVHCSPHTQAHVHRKGYDTNSYMC